MKIILILLLLSCGHPPAEDLSEQPTEEIKERYLHASKRAVTEFLDNSRIVSRGPHGEPTNIGDSLIWSGVALYGLPCNLGSVIENQIIAEINELQGGIIRHPSLPNDASLDGALGLYFGIADRISRCPGSIGIWTLAIKKHMDFVDSHSLRLNPKSNSVLTKEFDYVLHLLGYRLGLRSKPSDEVKLLLGLEIGEWARACILAKESCFRVHLGWLALKTVEALGESFSNVVKNNYCDATKRVNMPTVDHYCGRNDLRQWIEDFKYDVWEYRHQRCGLWEMPDAGGDRSPALDLLIALRLAYDPLSLAR